jgi:hypothetical protein
MVRLMRSSVATADLVALVALLLLLLLHLSLSS